MSRSLGHHLGSSPRSPSLPPVSTRLLLLLLALCTHWHISFPLTWNHYVGQAGLELVILWSQLGLHLCCFLSILRRCLYHPVDDVLNCPTGLTVCKGGQKMAGRQFSPPPRGFQGWSSGRQDWYPLSHLTPVPKSSFSLQRESMFVEQSSHLRFCGQ